MQGGVHGYTYIINIGANIVVIYVKMRFLVLAYDEITPKTNKKA